MPAEQTEKPLKPLKNWGANGKNYNLNYISSILMAIGTFIERQLWTRPTNPDHVNVLS